MSLHDSPDLIAAQPPEPIAAQPSAPPASDALRPRTGLVLLRAAFEAPEPCREFSLAHLDAGAAVLLGLEASRVLHQRPEQVLPAPLADAFVEQVRAACAGQPVAPQTVRVRDGIELLISVGQLGSVVAVSLVDVTEERREARALAALARAGRVLSGTLELDQTALTLTRLLVGELADGAAVELRDGRTVEIARVEHLRPELAEPLGEVCRLLGARLALTSQSWRCAGAELEAQLRALGDGDGPPAITLGSLTRLPLIAHGQLVGALWLALDEPVDRDTPARRELLQSLAAAGAVAVGHARLSAQLQAAHHQASALASSKDEMIARISHELRTPLTAILSWVRLLRRDNVSAARLARGLQAIEESARAQTQLVNDLVDISALAREQVTLARESVSLVEAVERATEALEEEAARKKLAFSIEVDPSLPPVRGDLGRLSQVAWNLVGNAVKFSRPEEQIRIQLTREGDQVVLRVSDTGAGIPRELLPRVFDRFWQRSDAGTGSGGLGLGLSLVHELVGRHGGTVAAFSAGEGQGATFTVRLPVAGAAPLPPRGPGAKED